MQIKKSTGESVTYKPEKIRESLKRAGAKPELISHVMQKIEKRLVDGMTTSKVYRILKRELHKENRCIAHRYNLRSALLKLGPAGFKFEKYVASILQAYGYETELPEHDLRGMCTKHEVDVVAKKDGRTVFIEAKFRNNFSDSVNLKDALATWSRFLDLRDGGKLGKCPKFDEAWIVTNEHFSESAQEFGRCKGMKMIGWSTPDKSLAAMVDHTALYPITVLDNLKAWELDRFAEKNLMLCREIALKKPDNVAARTGLALDRTTAIIGACKEIVSDQS